MKLQTARKLSFKSVIRSNIVAANVFASFSVNPDPSKNVGRPGASVSPVSAVHPVSLCSPFNQSAQSIRSVHPVSQRSPSSQSAQSIQAGSHRVRVFLPDSAIESLEAGLVVHALSASCSAVLPVSEFQYVESPSQGSPNSENASFLVSPHPTHHKNPTQNRRAKVGSKKS